MELSESEKEQIKKNVFPWFEHADIVLNDIYNDLANRIEEKFLSYTGVGFDDEYKITLKQLIIKYGAREVIESMFISLEQYFDISDSESADKVIDYIGRICFTRSKNKYGGLYGCINYIVKIAKNNLSYVNEKLLKKILIKHMTFENMEVIKNIVLDSMNWTSMKEKLCQELNINLEKF